MLTYIMMGQVPENPSNPSIWAEFTEYKTKNLSCDLDLHDEKSGLPSPNIK